MSDGEIPKGELPAVCGTRSLIPQPVRDAYELTHEPSGECCCAGHLDGYGECHKCKFCRRWIRPQAMHARCPAKERQP